MSMLSDLQTIMDMNDPWAEARKKLVGVWMFVNGKLVYIVDFSKPDNGVFINYNEGDREFVKNPKLEVWLPESGLYQVDKILLTISKVPKRQWLKSFSSSFYTINTPDKSPLPKDFKIGDIERAKKLDIAVDKHARVWYWENLIGYIKDSSNIVCTNLVYKQELLDWNKSCT
jgi:hypothetical protein